VPSYLNSPAIICHSLDEWKEKLSELMRNDELLMEVSLKGRKFVRDNYSPRIVKEKYKALFEKVLQ
jgi:glycosyltransferase involved in cell wall biosynthesis